MKTMKAWTKAALAMICLLLLAAVGSTGCSLRGHHCRSDGGCPQGQVCIDGWCELAQNQTSKEPDASSETSKEPQPDIPVLPEHEHTPPEHLGSETPGDAKQVLLCHSWTLAHSLKGASSAISFDKDSKLFASTSSDGSIQLWSLQSGEVRATYKIQGSRPTSVLIAPDRRAISGNQDGSLVLWDPLNVERPKLWKGHIRAVTSLAFDRTKQRVLSASEDGTIRIWSYPSGQQVKRLKHPDYSPLSVGPGFDRVITHPEAGFYVARTKDHKLVLWDTDSYERRTIPEQVAHPYMGFIQDGSQIAIAGLGMPKLLELQTAKWLPSPQPEKWPQAILGLTLPSSANMLAVASKEELGIWDPKSWKKIAAVPDSSALNSILFSLNGQYIAGTKTGSLQEAKIFTCQDCQPGATKPCYSGVSTTLGIGECKPGTRTCGSNRRWGPCTGEVVPQEERCNGKDDDCDGQMDEGYLTKTKIECVIPNCGDVRGVIQCTPDGKGVECRHPPSGGKELCNDKDDDCDGQIDEDFPTKGEPCVHSDTLCKNQPGRIVCYGGAVQCRSDVKKEICDHLDNDCDGLIDEDFPKKDEACSSGQGFCRSVGRLVCRRDGADVTCNAKAGAPATEQNDGLDGDCDGKADQGMACTEGATRPCYSGGQGCILQGKSFLCKGSCKAGTQTCVSGVWGACKGSVIEQTELCGDQKDSDCDGKLNTKGCVTAVVGVPYIRSNLAEGDAVGGLQLDPKGHLYFMKNNGGVQIYRFRREGHLERLTKEQSCIQNQQTGLWSGCYRDGPIEQARFGQFRYQGSTIPTTNSLAIDKQGVLYLADTINSRLRRIKFVTNTTCGTKQSHTGYCVTTIAGDGHCTCVKQDPSTRQCLGYQNCYKDGPSTQAQFNSPTSVTVTPSGILYVTESSQHRVRKLTPRNANESCTYIEQGKTLTVYMPKDGYCVTTIGTGQDGHFDGPPSKAQFSRPDSIAANRQGEIYLRSCGIKNSNGSTSCGIRKISLDGTVSTFTSKISGGLAFDPNDRLHVYITKSPGFIYELDPGGKETLKYGKAKILHPYTSNVRNQGAVEHVIFSVLNGLAFQANAVYSLHGKSISKIEHGRALVLQLYFDGKVDVARFNQPSGLVLDKAGNMYMADSRNHMIRKLDTQGNVTTIAGDGKCIPAVQVRSGGQWTITRPIECYRDGSGLQAQFYFPSALVVDANGALLIADSGNDSIRKLNLQTGIVSTLRFTDSKQQPFTLTNPVRLRLDSSGKLYILDGAKVHKVDPNGQVFTFPTQASISNIFIDSSNTLLVKGGASSLETWMKLTMDGKTDPTVFSPPFDGWLAKGPNGTIYGYKNKAAYQLVPAPNGRCGNSKALYCVKKLYQFNSPDADKHGHKDGFGKTVLFSDAEKRVVDMLDIVADIDGNLLIVDKTTNTVRRIHLKN